MEALSQQKKITSGSKVTSTPNTSFFGKQRLQKKLEIGSTNDAFEQEADAIADKVMSISDTQASTTPHTGPLVQRKCAQCEQEEKLQKKPLASAVTPLIQRQSHGTEAGTASQALSQQINSSKGGGTGMDNNTRTFMESRFGTDFSAVRIHTDAQAHKMSRSLNAQAFTVGNDIYFNEGQYKPNRSSGKHLLAHELVHTLQQGGSIRKTIQRSSNFCVPYDTSEEAENAEWWLRNTYMRMEGIETFGTEVYNLYDSYLSRSPGDSLTPRIFNSNSSYIHNSFQDDGAVKDDMDAVLDMVSQRLNRRSNGPLRPNVETWIPLSTFLSQSEMDNRPINFRNPFSVSGHIAGNIGSSAAGPDYRKITRANVVITKLLYGDTGYHLIELIPHYEVFDTIDFCPGDPGAPAETLITGPMSRLEATGEAYDMPFKVIFSPDPRSERYWF